MSKQQNECAWTRALCAELVKCGGKVFTNQRPYALDHGKTRLAQVAPPGWPDRWLAHAAWSGWLEFKAEKTRLDPLQAKNIREINERWPGGAYVVRRHQDGILLEDWTGRGLCLTQDHAEGLLLGLLSVSIRESAWIEERQRIIQSVVVKLCDRAKARGDECCAVVIG